MVSQFEIMIKVGIQIKKIYLTKTIMIITNLKKTLFSMVYANIFRRRKG